VDVREANQEDIAAITEIYNAEIENGFAHFGLEPVTSAEISEQFRGRGKHVWLVADENGAVLGFARSHPWKSRGAYQWTAELGVYVRQDVQSRGIGKALYHALLPRLEEAGFYTIVAGITLPNEPSVRLHEGLGMRRIGTFPEIGFKMGEWRDVGYWSMRLKKGDPI
jgi:phosphinothricin acetyltransferase